ncbi:MAG: ABC transporter ATP-binding protein [Clostridia bacterium]|nr:ABC transporter ATP-binding protein [Clostridia bacterium]
MKADNRPLKKRKYTIFDSLYFSLAAAPMAALLRIAIAAITAVVPTLMALATANFVDSAIALVKEGAANYAEGMERLLLPILFVLLIAAANMLTSKTSALAKIRTVNGLRAWLRPRLMLKRGMLDYSCIENTDDWNLIQRVFAPPFEYKTPEEVTYQTFLTLISAASTVISFISLITLITTEIWWVGIVITITLIPMLFVSLRGGKRIYDENREAAEKRRRAMYLADIMSSRETTAERTVFDYTYELSKDYDKNMTEAMDVQFAVTKKQFRYMNISSLTMTAASVISSVFLLVATLQGSISTGMFIALTGAIATMISSMRWQVSWLSQELAKYFGYMKDVTALIALPEQEGALEIPKRSDEPFRSLEFRSVRFRYPNTENWVLDGLSFNIESGKHYSFVGINGAGKTTITKLLLGLYRDYEGEILLNGRELKTYDLSELKGWFACVFQDFAKYQLELDENIMIGDVGAWKDGESLRNERMDSAVRLAGLKHLVDRIGLDAHIGKIEADGTDVSGGEWQRIVMARSIFSPSEIKILDEPTAALDPLAEAEVYVNFRDISKDRTTIFISHRLGSTKLADKIFVLDGGRAVEKGSHEQLMKEQGLYAEMYESQRGWYA